MQNLIFKEQLSITADNIKAKLLQLSREAKGLDPIAFETCLDNEMSLGLVFRDIELGSANGVSGTPTIFINGHRVEGVRDAARLRELILEAKRDLDTKTIATHTEPTDHSTRLAQ